MGYDVVLMGPVITKPKNWNTWTKIDMKGDKTIQEIIDEIKLKYDFNLSSIIAYDIQIWCSFTNNNKERLNEKLEDILKSLNFDLYNGKKYQVFSISGETEDMTDVYPPVLKYHLCL